MEIETYLHTKDGRISKKQALEHADSRNDLGLAIRTSRSRSADDAPEGLSIDKFD